jgi:transcriptional regulator with XRE-family HTH domain
MYVYIITFGNFFLNLHSHYNHTLMDVKAIIKEKGWTIERVAAEIGISRVTLSQNLSRNPTVNTLQRIASVIGCKVGDFFRDEIEISAPVQKCPHCGKPIIIRAEIQKAE